MRPEVAVIVPANTEWQAILELFPGVEMRSAPYGDWFSTKLDDGYCQQLVLFCHGGWGKIAAAASTQYVVDRWSPKLLVNLGTCGGFAGEVEKGTVILADRTVVYDIFDLMGDQDAPVAHYSTDLDLSWLKSDLPDGVRRALLVSADRDLVAEEIAGLRTRFGAIAGDWESGAIAWVASRNGIRCLILRGVTDLVSSDGGEAYGNMELWVENTRTIMGRLLELLPGLIGSALEARPCGE